MVYKTVYTEIDVDVNMSDFDTQDLLDELESRGELPVEGHGDAKGIVEKIWMLRRHGKDYQRELDYLIYRVLDKIV